MKGKITLFVEKISHTKFRILRSCGKTKTWTDIIDLTGLSKPTVKSHIDRLMKESLLEKTDDGYKTTLEGNVQINLRPHKKPYASAEKIPSEVYQMISEAIFPGMKLKEKMKGIFAMGILKNLGEIKKVRLFLDNLSKAIRDSVIVWLPPDSEFDKSTYKIVNQLIGTQINAIKKLDNKGKFQIIIDFDLPLALDNVIKDEKDSEIKKKLIDNRDEILQTLYNKWLKITK